jgi:hypothetical protein
LDDAELRNEQRRDAILAGERPTFRAETEPDGPLILVRIPELDTAAQAESADQVERIARDLISIKLDVPVDSFDLVVAMAGRATEH